MNEDFVFTKEEKVNKLFKVLNVLKNSLQCKRMVVGGSMAMYVHGFNVEPHDLDIEIEGISGDSLRALSTMARINKDMKSDILRTVFYNNIEFGDVLSVIKKKMDMKREKDYKSLVDYINQLTYFTK